METSENLRDRTGHRYGDLIVVASTKERAVNGEIIWKCKCRCGEVAYYRTSKLASRSSCGTCDPSERTGVFTEEAKRAAKLKGTKRFSELSLDRQLSLINDYCFGKNIDKLTKSYGVDSISCRNGIEAFRERLNTMHSLHYMVRTEKTKVAPSVIDRALATSSVEEAIRPLLSDDDAEELTLQEELYCYLWVYTGSNDTAIKESGFSDVIPKETVMRRQLLGMFLREKPNLKEYIGILKDARISEVKTSKQIVQYELINQVEQLRNAVAHSGKPSDRGHLLRAIELLGKTIGAFEDRLKVTEINASDALDELLDMAKKSTGDSVKEIPYDETADTYEVVNPSDTDNPSDSSVSDKLL